MTSTTCDTQTAINLTVARSEDSYRTGISHVMGMGGTHPPKTLKSFPSWFTLSSFE